MQRTLSGAAASCSPRCAAQLPARAGTGYGSSSPYGAGSAAHMQRTRAGRPGALTHGGRAQTAENCAGSPRAWPASGACCRDLNTACLCFRPDTSLGAVDRRLRRSKQRRQAVCFAVLSRPTGAAPAAAGRPAGTRTSLPFETINRPKRPSVKAQQTFDFLWPRYRRELQIGAEAAAMIAEEVSQVCGWGGTPSRHARA